jgi:GT2 family glycosyltransferase
MGCDSVCVSAVIVTYNSEGVVAECLRSLLGSDGIERIELIVVDNASRDSTLNIVKREAPSAKLIANPRNRGLAAANNQGLKAATYDLLLICNPDVVFDTRAVQEMADLMRRRPDAGWVVPKLVYEDGSVQTSAGDLPTLPQPQFGRQSARRRSRTTTAGF